MAARDIAAWARRPLVRFTLTTLVVLCVVTIATTIASYWKAREEAKLDALNTAELFAHTAVAPLRLADLESSDAAASRDSLDRTVRELISTSEIYRVKVWSVVNEDEVRIAYSDLEDLEGLVVPISDVLRGALDSGDPVVVPVPPDPAHRFEQRDGSVEVYHRYVDVDGTIAVAELYLETNIGSKVRTYMLRNLPIAIGGPVLLAAMTFPLALRLARTHASEQSRRRRLAEAALVNSSTERRRIAQIVHDGPVQELSALRIDLEREQSLGVRPSEGDAGHTRTAVADRIRHQVIALRDLLDELNPEEPSVDDIQLSLYDVAEPIIGERPVDIEITGSSLTDVDELSRMLAYRTAAELMRNALLHAHPDRVSIDISLRRSQVRVRVSDDGAGFEPNATPKSHHGLRLVRSALNEADGTMRISSSAAGTTVVAEFPAGDADENPPTSR